MPTYRLLTGPGVELEAFAADDDQDALTRGRELATGHAQPPAHDSGKPGEPVVRGDFRVERGDEDRWSLVHAWVPLPETTPQDC